MPSTDDSTHHWLPNHRPTRAGVCVTALFFAITIISYALTLVLPDCRPREDWTCLPAIFAPMAFIAFLIAAALTALAYGMSEGGAS